MKEFMMIFRSEEQVERPTPEEMQAQIKVWQEWIAGIVAKGQFVATNALGMQGKVVRGDKETVVTDGPYVEVKEMVGGYIIVKAHDLEGAIHLSKGCPTLSYGGSVEVRDVMVF
ncbi:MAG: hypothetical protein KTR24_16435 [Saprospiraceae bacterium]|nr:hypothetical protein [Saprospiraceae bacterium]